MAIQETVCFSDYEIVNRGESALGLQQEITTYTRGFRCPRCSFPNRPIGHGESGKCPSCKLHFRLYGNGLHCSDEHIPSHSDVRRTFTIEPPTPRAGWLERLVGWINRATSD